MKNNKIQSQIDKLQALVDMDGIPQGDKDDAQAKIDELKEKLKSSGEGDKAPKKKAKKKKSAKKKAAPKDSDEDCAEEIKKLKGKITASKKPRKEPVKHTRETRVVNALKTISNALLEGNENDPAMITKIDNFITRMEIKIKDEFLGLKRVKHDSELKEKFEQAHDKAA